MKKLVLKIKNKLREKSGLSMVNVLAAFAVFLMTILMFSQAVNLSLNLFTKSQDIRKSIEADYAKFYSETKYSTGSGTSIKFEETNGDTFTINSAEGSFSDGIDRTIYYFGGREKG